MKMKSRDIGSFDGVSYEVYPWGVLLYSIDAHDYLVKHRYVGNGSDPMFLDDLVADFKARFNLGGEEAHV